jgi:D-amino-acid dehydrogenase
MEKLEVLTQPAPAELVESARRAARADTAAGLHFPNCAHVVDPLEVVRAFASAATARGASFMQRDVRALQTDGAGIQIITDAGPIAARSAIVCAGVWSAPLLAPFGLKAPLEAARGYHVQMPGAKSLVDAPILYSDANILVTPMAGRVRATSFMEFAGTDAPPDPRKPCGCATSCAISVIPAKTSPRAGRFAPGAAGLSTRHGAGGRGAQPAVRLRAPAHRSHVVRDHRPDHG